MPYYKKTKMHRLLFLIISLSLIIQTYGQRILPRDRIEHVERNYVLGNFQKNHNDTATVIYDRVISADSTIENDCGKAVCNIQIKFSSNIPQINIEAHDIFIDTTYDINNDGIKELLIYHWWVQHNWTIISVYSLIYNKWTELQKSEAFVAEDKDYENRVLKKGETYYLIGDSWNKNFTLTYKSKTKINK